MQKVSDASGSRYSASSSKLNDDRPLPSVSSKPAFTPTQSSRASSGFNPLANSKPRVTTPKDINVDEDGWGQDAPQVTRRQLEKVESSYQPTKVNMRELISQKPEQSKFTKIPNDDAAGRRDVVKGEYQPVGKVDIAALRRQAQETKRFIDDKPSTVKGSYEPVGKVDIAAIRARAQKSVDELGPAQNPIISPAARVTAGSTGGPDQSSLPEQSTSSVASERLMTLPKPKVGNRFGAGASTFTGTKAPIPGGSGLGSPQGPAAPSVGAGRTFADQAGKTPSQLWAEKKARERGASGLTEKKIPGGVAEPAVPVVNQVSGNGEWKSGYEGKSWAPVQTTRTGQSQGSQSEQPVGEDIQDDNFVPSTASVGAIRNRFKDAPPMGVENNGVNDAVPNPPGLDLVNNPNVHRGMPTPSVPTRPPLAAAEQEEEEHRETPKMPTPPPQPPRSPTPPTPPAIDSGSPIRVAMPVGRGNEQEVENARDEQFSPPPAAPFRSIAQAAIQEDDLTETPPGDDIARRTGQAAAATSFGNQLVSSAPAEDHGNGKRALVLYDYEKAEDNELELKEGEYIFNIDMVDNDWWMGESTHGVSGLFPKDYVELVDDDSGQQGPAAHDLSDEPARESDIGKPGNGATATAMYDYDAAEDNELSFPEHATITDVVCHQCSRFFPDANHNLQEFPDEDWWSGEYNGKQGLFPAAYVRLND